MGNDVSTTCDSTHLKVYTMKLKNCLSMQLVPDEEIRDKEPYATVLNHYHDNPENKAGIQSFSSLC